MKKRGDTFAWYWDVYDEQWHSQFDFAINTHPADSLYPFTKHCNTGGTAERMCSLLPQRRERRLIGALRTSVARLSAVLPSRAVRLIHPELTPTVSWALRQRSSVTFPAPLPQLWNMTARSIPLKFSIELKPMIQDILPFSPFLMTPKQCLMTAASLLF